MQVLCGLIYKRNQESLNKIINASIFLNRGIKYITLTDIYRTQKLISKVFDMLSTNTNFCHSFNSNFKMKI